MPTPQKHHLLNKILINCGLSLFLMSCGSDRDVELEELRLDLKQLQSEVRELKSSHRAELDLIKQKLLAQQQRSHQLRKEGVDGQSSPFNGMGKLRSEAQRRVGLTRARRDQYKAVQIARQLASRRSVDDIARVLNEQQLKTSLGRSYTSDDVLKIIEVHDLAGPK